jgi:hypothetical protein
VVFERWLGYVGSHSSAFYQVDILKREIPLIVGIDELYARKGGIGALAQLKVPMAFYGSRENRCLFHLKIKTLQA